MPSFDPFMRAENSKRFCTLLAGETDSEQRKRLQALLQREGAALRALDEDPRIQEAEAGLSGQ
jgi:hypothetical protein